MGDQDPDSQTLLAISSIPNLLILLSGSGEHHRIVE